MRRLTLLAALAALTTCGESSLEIRVIFPDATSRAASSRLLLYAVDPGVSAAGSALEKPQTCMETVGKTAAALGKSLLSSTAIQLVPPPKESPSFAEVPMRRLLITALVYDLSERLYLQACAPVEASPGAALEVTLRLTCAPGRTPCIDGDGDGAPSNLDCDDSDPCRSQQIKEAASFCALPQASFPALPKACLELLAKQGKQAPAAPYCGDGIDQDCSGADLACVKDDDCDTFAPPADCDDQDPAINPSATESCDGKDNNCNGTVDEGCSPCDVDGDGHAAKDASDPSCTIPKDDPDDHDAGVHPKTTADSAGAEGGTVLTALRGFCASTPNKNGVAEREVDHDGDGKAAKDDGCPPASCDQDGDGFQAASCSPPKPIEDCNDSDPRIFPGAPEKCGDGIAQGCAADLPCSCDGDGDGYCPPADCDDGNPQRHPFAVETCNRIDDDCDGLIDEGNPDANGKAIPTNQPLCNDDNDGECAPACTPGTAGCSSKGKTLSGLCVCSPVTPNAIRDELNRVRCTGESLSAVSPRCFGARQPQQELCNGKDDNCNALLTDDGKDQCLAPASCCFAAGVGSCKDLTTDLANCGSCGKPCDPAKSDACVDKVCKCGSGAACGTYESCVGGVCTCGGCKNSLGSCVAGTSTTSCGKAGELCKNCNSTYGTCQSQSCYCSGGCRNPSTGTCVSGSTVSACGKNAQDCVQCPSGASCTSGTCVCSGCLNAAGACVTSLSTTQCGKGGVACQDCSSLAGQCKSAACNTFAGTCQTSNLTGPCNDGLYCTVNDTCTAGSCVGPARDCSALADACNNASCNETADTCEKQPKSNGTACMAVTASGTCLGGVCCTGCVKAGACEPGSATAACGKGGGACVDCGAQSCNSNGVCE